MSALSPAQQQYLASLSPRQMKELRARVDLCRAEKEHRQKFGGWMSTLQSHLVAERGRASELARFLGVRRQNVSRWIVRRWHDEAIPAWAAVGAMVWYFHKVERPDGFVPPQADIALLVSPQVDKLVRGSADKERAA